MAWLNRIRSHSLIFHNLYRRLKDFSVNGGKEIRGAADLTGDRDHLACAKAKAMNRVRGQVNECAGHGGDSLVTVTDLDGALDDVEGFVQS